MSNYFLNKRIVITGASSGIGRALSESLAEQGAHLVLIARNETRLEHTKQAISKGWAKDMMQSRAIEVYPLDICDQPAVAKAMEKIYSKPVDILINNAGIASNDHFENLDDSCFHSMIETNFLAQVSMCRHALVTMKKMDNGQIVNIASMAGVIGIAGYTAYSASKFALVGFTRSLRNELAGTGIKTTLVMPSDIDTPQLEAEDQTRTAANKAAVGTGAKPLPASFAAKKILSAIQKQKPEVVVSSFSGRVLLCLCQTFPAISRLVLDSITAKHQNRTSV